MCLIIQEDFLSITTEKHQVFESVSKFDISPLIILDGISRMLLGNIVRNLQFSTTPQYSQTHHHIWLKFKYKIVLS